MAIGGSKHFGFVKLRPDLQPVKVVTVTLGHPVEMAVFHYLSLFQQILLKAPQGLP